MTATRYTVTATRCHGFIRFIRHDLDALAADALCSKLNADDYEDVTRTEQVTLTPEQADALAKRGQERAVGCVVAAVCAVIVATVVFTAWCAG